LEPLQGHGSRLLSGFKRHARHQTRRVLGVWIPKMPSKSFMPEFHQIDEFNLDSAFVNSDNSASHSLGQTNLRNIRPSFRDGPFGLFRRINLIAPSRFLRPDLPFADEGRGFPPSVQGEAQKRSEQGKREEGREP
jgi:hypothetical protein